MSPKKNLYGMINDQVRASARTAPEPVFEIARMIRLLRQTRGLSGAELCRRAGDLDPRTLTALEKGRIRNPSIRTLQSLARGLSLPLHALFQEESVVPRAAVIPGSQKGAFSLEFPGKGIKVISFTPLMPDFFCGKLILGARVKITESFLSHPAPIFISLLIGRLEVTLDDKSYALKEGENLLIQGSMKHVFCNPSQKDASFLMVTAPSFLKR